MDQFAKTLKGTLLPQAHAQTQPEQVGLAGTTELGTTTTHTTPTGLSYKAIRVASQNGKPLPHAVILIPNRPANFVAPNTPGTPQGTASGAAALQAQMDKEHQDMVGDYFSKYGAGDTQYNIPESVSGSLSQYNHASY